MQAYAILFAIFFAFGAGLAVAVLRIVRVAAYFPQIGLKGLFATGGVLLLEEGLAILSDLREILDTLVDSCLNLGEASARCEAARRHADVHTVGVSLADVETRAVGVLGGCGAVRTDQVITVTVTIYFLRFCQGALYELNTRRISNFSHNVKVLV